jgi:hypothetical protein
MSHIALPNNPDRETLLGFWISLILVAGAMLLAVALAAGAPVLLVLPVTGAAAAALLALGLARERLIARLYKRWNGAAIAYAQRASALLLVIWYRTVVAVVARAGGKGRLDVHGSAWLPRGTLEARAYGDPGGASTDRDAEGGLLDFARWAVRSGRPWAIVLLPLLALTRGLETRRRKTVAADIYTLY